MNGVACSWWNDRNGTVRYFWSGSNSSIQHPVCQCGIDGNCFDDFCSAIATRLYRTDYPIVVIYEFICLNDNNIPLNFLCYNLTQSIIIVFTSLRPNQMNKESSPIKRFCQSHGSILDAFCCLVLQAHTHWAGSSARER